MATSPKKVAIIPGHCLTSVLYISNSEWVRNKEGRDFRSQMAVIKSDRKIPYRLAVIVINSSLYWSFDCFLCRFCTMELL